MTNTIAIDLILPNPEQPRTVFDEGELFNLAQSIREQGVLLPIVVEEAGENYILIDGERRVRAARIAGLTEIPASIVPPLNGTSVQDRLTRAVVANVQRADLDPMEEARAYGRMRDEFGWSTAEISRRTGAYPKRIADELILLKLEPEIQDMVARKKIGHDVNMIRAFLDIPESQARISLVQGLALRKVTVKGSIESARRLTEVLNSKESFMEQSPGLAMAKKGIKVDPAQGPRRWNAMMQLGSVPPWGMVSKLAFDVCEECELKPQACPAVCGRCQMVDLLRKLLEAAK